MATIDAADLAAILESRRYVAWYPAGECYLNLAGDYDYLESAYYVSQDWETRGEVIHPTCKEALDAYVPPLLLEKARRHNLPVPNFYISNGFFEPPVIIDPINPFMIRSRTVLKSGREHALAKSMTRNFKYAICCQELPPGARVTRFRAVLGWSTTARYREIAKAVWEVFQIPLARVRVVVTESGEMLLSDISQLPPARLGSRETARLMEQVQWRI
jgi:hypothetical protein